jgi:hypothetical protein
VPARPAKLRLDDREWRLCARCVHARGGYSA